MTSETRPIMRRLKISPSRLALVGALVALPLLAACKEEHGPVSAVPRPVLSTVVAPEAAPAPSFVGTVEPRYSVNLAFQTLGRLAARDAGVGDLVKKDAVIARLDPLQLDLAAESAGAQRETASVQAQKAAASLERLQTLFDQGTVPAATLDAAKRAKVAADANLDSANSEARRADERRGYAELRPDFDGVVSAVSAEIGQVVAAGQTVMTVARSDIREAVVDVPDSLIGTVAPDSSFTVALISAPEVTATGTVREIAPQSDAATRTRRLRITLANPPEAFRLGATIAARQGAAGKPIVRLPLSALYEHDGKAEVWLVDAAKGTVAPQAVTVAARDGTSFVADGLAAGQRVVTAGVHSLEPGQKVRILDEGMSR